MVQLVRCKDPDAETHDWEVWPIDPKKFEEGLLVPIGPKRVYRSDDYYFAEEAYFNEVIKPLVDKFDRKVSFNRFRSNFRHRRLDDRRFGENKKGYDLNALVEDIKRLEESQAKEAV